MDIMTFYTKNLESLDQKWKVFCFKNFKGRMIGDMYNNHHAFWSFVEKEYKNDWVWNRKIKNGRKKA